jgi:hypothetical protein
LQSVDRSYEFPAGGKHDIPTAAESELLECLRRDDPLEKEKVKPLESRCPAWSPSYDVVIVGIRIAILAVRTDSAPAFRSGILATIAGISNIDWRDALRALAILENCGARLGIALRDEAAGIARLTTSDRASSIIRSYFSREDGMRRISVLGIAEVERDGRLTFCNEGLWGRKQQRS